MTCKIAPFSDRTIVHATFFQFNEFILKEAMIQIQHTNVHTLIMLDDNFEFAIESSR